MHQALAHGVKTMGEEGESHTEGLNRMTIRQVAGDTFWGWDCPLGGHLAVSAGCHSLGVGGSSGQRPRVLLDTPQDMGQSKTWSHLPKLERCHG